MFRQVKNDYTRSEVSALNACLIILCIIAAMSVLYLFVIAPRVGNTEIDTSMLNHGLFAHRGLYNPQQRVPENSLDAFSYAVDYGYGIELDVRLSRDGKLFVFHDDSLQRMCGDPRSIEKMTSAEINSMKLADTELTIPAFSDVLNLVDGKVPIIVEIKCKQNCRLICEEIDRVLKNYSGEYCIESFNPLAVRWYKKHRKNVVRGQLAGCFGRNGSLIGTLGNFLLGNVFVNVLGRPDFIAYRVRDSRNISFRLCRLLFNVTTVAWTVRNEDELRAANKLYDSVIFEGFIPNKSDKQSSHVQ